MQHRDSVGLFGGWSGVHVGDDAILLETLRVLEEKAPGAQIQLFCSTPLVTERLIECKQNITIVPALRYFTRDVTLKLLSSKNSLERLSNRINWLYQAFKLSNKCSTSLTDRESDELLSFIGALHRCKVMVLSGGGYLNSNLRLSWLYSSLLLINICNRLDIPVYLCGQTIGPFNSAKDKWLTAKGFQHVSLIGTREEKSIEVLKDLKIPDFKIIREKDAVWELEKKSSVFEKDLNAKSKDGAQRIGLSLQPRGKDEYKFDQELVKKILATYPQHSLLFFPHTPEDVSYQKEILQKLHNTKKDISERFDIVYPELLPQEHKSLVSSCQACIGTRFHFHVFALSTATPSVSIFRRIKTTGIFEDFDMGYLSLDPKQNNFSVESILHVFSELLKSASEHKQMMQERISGETIPKHSILKKAIEAYHKLI